MRLAHCPFCGEDQQISLSSDLSEQKRAWTRRVLCVCGAAGPICESLNQDTAKQAAIDSWNNRITSDEDIALRVAFALSS